MDKDMIQNSPEEGGTGESFSRREALKRMAKIALGIGAAGMLPAALNSCKYNDYDDYYDYYSNYYGNYYSDYAYYSDYYSEYYDNYGY